jgi:hypothetical protein
MTVCQCGAPAVRGRTACSDCIGRNVLELLQSFDDFAAARAAGTLETCSGCGHNVLKTYPIVLHDTTMHLCGNCAHDLWNMAQAANANVVEVLSSGDAP